MINNTAKNNKLDNNKANTEEPAPTPKIEPSYEGTSVSAPQTAEEKEAADAPAEGEADFSAFF